MAERVIAYIDGFNLYHGMREAEFRRYFWLNVHELARSFLQAGQQLIETKYFTARITGPWDKKQRQTDYIEALGSVDGLTRFFGHYRDDEVRCKGCGRSWMEHEEKMTDVRIATELLMDAHANRFDVAMLVSGDSDLVPPIKAIHDAFPQKRVVVFFPPERQSFDLKEAAKGSLQIGRAKLAHAQLPDSVTTKQGFVVKRPAEWCSKPPSPT